MIFGLGFDLPQIRDGDTPRSLGHQTKDRMLAAGSWWGPKCLSGTGPPTYPFHWVFQSCWKNPRSNMFGAPEWHSKAWSPSGHRLLAVQSVPGSSSCVNLWALEGSCFGAVARIFVAVHVLVKILCYYQKGTILDHCDQWFKMV